MKTSIMMTSALPSAPVGKGENGAEIIGIGGSLASYRPYI
jgi:hypothetical protein